MAALGGDGFDATISEILMAKALGVGGVFFKCRDRKALADWYGKALGLQINDFGGTVFPPAQLPAGTYCVWGPFDADTECFAPSTRDFMLNLVVDDLEAALAQVVAAGGQQVGGIDEYDYGRFGWFVDPEGNKIELWEPRGSTP